MRKMYRPNVEWPLFQDYFFPRGSSLLRHFSKQWCSLLVKISCKAAKRLQNRPRARGFGKASHEIYKLHNMGDLIMGRTNL